MIWKKEIGNGSSVILICVLLSDNFKTKDNINNCQ